jgi:hypothetical protein
MWKELQRILWNPPATKENKGEAKKPIKPAEKGGMQ